MKTWTHRKKAGKARRRCERNRYKNILKANAINSKLKNILDKIKDAVKPLWE